MINSIPYNIQKEKFLRALIYTIFYDELQVCSTNYSADDILDCATHSCESNWGVNVIMLFSVVLMGTSHSIRNKLNIIRVTALKSNYFRRQACFPFVFSLWKVWTQE